jgi:hypothetical protein
VLRRKRDDEEGLSKRYQPGAIRTDSPTAGRIKEEDGAEQMKSEWHSLRDFVFVEERGDVACPAPLPPPYRSRRCQPQRD